MCGVSAQRLTVLSSAPSAPLPSEEKMTGTSVGWNFEGEDPIAK